MRINTLPHQTVQQLIHNLEQDSRDHGRVRTRTLDQTIKCLKQASPNQNQNAEEMRNCIRNIRNILAMQDSKRLVKKFEKINYIDTFVPKSGSEYVKRKQPSWIKENYAIIDGNKFDKRKFTDYPLSHDHKFSKSPLARQWGEADSYYNLKDGKTR
ncbi:hypothetical protein [Vibrio aestuarianus]|uniref:hypothetical protein n=1 Tax=Vibrio aestuarianus TaxID=28171 RepID=UPI00237CCAA4|nr:hypothetical protein [Vibrio aestuarianus]MDE1237856.1 hypothetical protein [Vibrio aestuarianus]